MAKKTIAVLLVLCTFAFFTGCSNAKSPSTSTPPSSPNISTPDASTPDTSTPPAPSAPTQDAKVLGYNAYTAFSDSLSQTGDNAQFDIDMVMDIAADIDGETIMDMSVDANIKMIVENGLTKYSMLMDMKEYGQLEMYSDGENVYCEVNGQQVEISIADIQAQIDSSVNIAEFTQNAVKDCQIETVGDTAEYTLIIDGDAISGFSSEILASSLGDLGTDVDIDMSDTTILLVTDLQDNPKSMAMDFTMNLTAEGETANVSAYYAFTFNALGEGVTIDFGKLA